MPLAIKQQNISQHRNKIIKIRQLIIARYATVSPIIKMRGFGIHMLNYFCLSNEEIENQCKKKCHKPTKSGLILWIFLKLRAFYMHKISIFQLTFKVTLSII